MQQLRATGERNRLRIAEPPQQSRRVFLRLKSPPEGGIWGGVRLVNDTNGGDNTIGSKPTERKINKLHKRMNNKYSLPKDGGLISESAPRDIIHRYEKIHTKVYENEYEGVQYVADNIVKAIRMYNEIHCSNEVYEESQPFVLGLTTGRTPLGLYRELVKRHHEGQISFRNVSVYSLDEFYPIRSTEQQSRNYRIHEEFLNHIDILPENVPANEFLNLEGDKISTSRNWAVWLHEYLDEFPGKEDVLRYVLCANAPESKDNDFTWKDFQARNNNELVAVLGNFVNRALVLTQKYYGGKVPACGELTDYDRQSIAEVAAVKASLEGNIENYRFREALKDAMNIARIGNKYLADTEPWKVVKTDPARVETILNIALQITANTAIAIEPFMPFSAEKILRMLAVGKFGWERLGAMDLIPAGHAIGEPALLFEKIEDDVIQRQLDKLAATKAANEAAEVAQNVEPQKDTIQFDDFQKMDIRVSTILAAEKVAKTKKLLKLTIDTGIDKREIVSGIAEHFTPEELVGQQVLVLVNLAPRELKGILSNGMILMAEDASGKLRLLQPGEATHNGAVVG